jgi:predicted RNA methylase
MVRTYACLVLSPARRRELGAFYTPPDVASRLVELALDGLGGLGGLDGLGRAPKVCDPACGDGAFLIAAGAALVRRGLAPATVARDLLWGCDIDPAAVAATRDAIVAWSGVDPVDHLLVADGLTMAQPWRGRFDAVVGNPPFLNQLERATVRRRPLPPDLDAIARPYTDTAWLFLLVARDLLRPNGRAVLVQPQSLVAARDAAPVRDLIAPSLEGLWWCDEIVFDASVRVCAPVLGMQSGSVRRWSGRDVSEISTVAPPRSSWSVLVPSDVPDVDLPLGGATTSGVATLGDIATATAGFRDEYYGLQPAVTDDRDGELPLLITSGLVDVGRVLWGERPTRFCRAKLIHPRVDTAKLMDPLARWVAQRLVPKVVVATQTKVVEAAVDVAGAWVPSTPVISVHADAADLWRIAALLTAPAVSAWAMRHHAGAALNPDAIKLSARQLLDVPLPADEEAWGEGAEALRTGKILDAGRAMSRAFGTGDEVFDWWQARLPRTVQRY